MKEQPIETPTETKEYVIGHSIGQRPIHITYEPPGPLPQFRARPKLSPAQPKPAPKQRTSLSATAKAATAKAAENTTIKLPADLETAAAEKRG